MSLAVALAVSCALLAPRALAQNPDDQDVGQPLVEKQLEAGPPPREPPAQEPLVVRPPPKPAPRPVNALPLVSKDAPPPLIWKWRTFSLADYIITGVGAGITLTAAIVTPRSKHSLSGGVGFDDDVREALRAPKLADRYVFRDASDVGLSLAVTWPFVADALTTAWWFRGSRESAQEMALISLQTLAISGAIQGTTNVLVSRERPFGPDCGAGGELPGDAIDCTGTFHYRSFFSGHSAFSFTGAALICVHHFENELLGPPWDALSCVGGYAVAATTATFRVVADVHYASDVLIGASLGTLVGYTVPLLHYRNFGGSSRARPVTSFRLHVTPAPGGVGLLGIF
ncbi:MAG TPA: phosphatase PAP2 family protein [Polyangiaceae bacterium]|nr:phosphatase PAP2 family protein [Polyangiaceae bacterium]